MQGLSSDAMNRALGVEHFVTLDELAQRLALPCTWLRELADAGEIPAIRVRQRRFFDLEAVRTAITARADDTARTPHRGSVKQELTP